MIAAGIANAWLIFSYGIINDNLADTSFSIHPLITPVDEAIPFWPNPLLCSMYILHPWVLVVRCLHLFWKRQPYKALRASSAVAIAYIISIPIFTTLPACIPREGLDGGFLMNSIWASDAPCSAFPSLHAATATIGMIAGGFFYTGFFATIILIVVPLRQHVVADVVGGIIIGILSNYIAGFLAYKLLKIRDKVINRLPLQDRNHRQTSQDPSYREHHTDS